MSTFPVTLITGFLGSGKTTLLNNLLHDQQMADTAVIINEFGDVAIDHLLVESAIENAVVLQSGCICCTVRGDLVDTLGDLVAKAERGDIPRFSRIVIETTGLADPTSVVRLFAGEPLLAETFHLRAVVTTVDAVNGMTQLDKFEEAARQVALADVLILTKTDLVEPQATNVLRDRLHHLNPGAEIIPVVAGKLSPDDLFAHAPAAPSGPDGDVGRWLKLDAFGPREPHRNGHDHAHGDASSSHDDHHNHDDAHHGHLHHDASIHSFTVTLDAPIERDALRGWLASILSLRGQDLLRMKGIVNVLGLDGPMVVHAVQDIVHPPMTLAAWPSDDHSTRIVFITRNISQPALQRSLEAMAREHRVS
ncbi:putative GTP-binding protein YjiA [Hartmannibacter diazotrophicus]|uniref:Putative GTP-binding protein YjiA n=1 Tax=Hartmannibacter diazotrophicus TaxID=1482074 RepID=A0A2C9DAT5_9HYPH|nr:GTP-binding protein [Hartmannibacter diazotrophicus]SON56715.1 putative GTP-binding protein YjiA [Hartmannibacter diazotrophicus]